MNSKTKKDFDYAALGDRIGYIAGFFLRPGTFTQTLAIAHKFAPTIF